MCPAGTFVFSQSISYLSIYSTDCYFCLQFPPQEPWFYEEYEVPDAGEFDDPDPDSDYDYDYDEKYRTRKKKRGGKVGTRVSIFSNYTARSALLFVLLLEWVDLYLQRYL